MVWCGVVAIVEIRVPPSFSVCLLLCLSLPHGCLSLCLSLPHGCLSISVCLSLPHGCLSVSVCLSVCFLCYICNILVCLFERISEAAYAERSLPLNLPTGTREDDIPRWVVLLKRRGGEMKKGVKRGEKKR